MFDFITKDRNLLFELARRHVKTQYRGSFLGFLWTILNPLLTMLVMWLIFSRFFGEGDPYYPIYLLTGTIVFSAFRVATTQSLTSLDNNRGILLRTKLSPYVFPFSYTSASLINFFLSVIALIPFMIWLSIQQGINLFTYRLFFILLMLPAFWLFQYGIGLFLACIYVFFRDVLHLYSVFLVLWNYITPVFYKAGAISDGFVGVVIRINPMYHFTSYFRECVYMGAVGADPLSGAIELMPYLPEWSKLGYMYLFGVISTAIGIAAYVSLRQKVLMKL